MAKRILSLWLHALVPLALAGMRPFSAGGSLRTGLPESIRREG